MTSLTETAYYARRTINYAIIGLICLVFLKIGLSSFISYWKKIHPPPPPPPNVLFGKLPPIEFPKIESTTSALTYKLETVTGDFPKMPDQAKVYFIPQIQANLVGFDAAQEQATKMAFTGAPAKINDRTYEWTDKDYSAKTLTIDIVNGNFKIFYDYLKDQSVFGEKDLPGKDRAILEAKSFLSSLDLLKADLEKGKITVSYLRLTDDQLVEVSSLLEANLAKITFWRGNIDDLPVYYGGLEKGPVVVIFSGAKEEKKRLISFDYRYQLIDYENYATYPIIAPALAYEKLKSGNAAVVSYRGDKKETIIREVVLGYFESDKIQAYLYPIYIFIGDDDFIGYVPAIKEEWIKK